jgi:predicted RNA-binding Zn ribbon-like protein
VLLNSYIDGGVIASVNLINELALGHARGKRVSATETIPAVARVLADDPPSLAQLRGDDAPGFIALARRLREVFDDLHRGDIDAAASRLNDLLAVHLAHPHLAKEQGIWRLHHHAVDAALVPMWTAICAEGLARMIGAGYGNRFHTCDANDCDCVFFDTSRNGSRRFCSTTCQNRTKTAAFRRRQATEWQ